MIHSLVDQLYEVHQKLTSFEIELLKISSNYEIEKQDFIMQIVDIESPEIWHKKIKSLKDKKWVEFYKNEIEKLKNKFRQDLNDTNHIKDDKGNPMTPLRTT